MCGISVIVALQGHTHQSQQSASGALSNGINGIHPHMDVTATKLASDLDKSLDLIAHRGPDSRGQWISKDKRIGPPPLTW